MKHPDKYKKYKTQFRQISHPRSNLHPTEEYSFILFQKEWKIPDVNPYSVAMELHNYYDPYDSGLDIGKKNIKHSDTMEAFNRIFFEWEKKPLCIELNRSARRLWRGYCTHKKHIISKAKLNSDKIYDHITRQKKIYGTMNPFSPIRVLGSDIDNKTDNPQAVLPFLYLFQCYYPKSFYDGGSSGKSLHYYPKIYMVPLYDYYLNNNISDNWALYANTIITHTSRIFKIYGHNILCPEHTLVLKTLQSGKTKLVPEYRVEFDAFKASYPEYEFYRDKKGKPRPTKMIKCGVLHKLPNIFTVEDLITLRDAPVYSIIDHLSVSYYLANCVLLSGSYSDEDYKKLTEAKEVIEPVLIAHNIFLPSQTKKVVTLPPPPEQGPIKEEEGGEENKELCTYTGTSENVTDIALESDAMLRSRRYLYYCFTQYIICEGREPTEEEYRRDYRADAGTGAEDEGDRKRLAYIYRTNIDKMRKYLYGSLAQQIDVMEEKLGLEQEDIDRMSTYDRRLWKREVAIAAVWINISLTNTVRIRWNELMYGHMPQHYNRELAVPTSALEKFIECLKEKEYTPNGCNPRKAKALRQILTDISWIQCVDDTVIIAAFTPNHKGRARRYILLPDHPNYKRFESIVGPDRIEYWKEFREEQLRLRAIKIKKRKIG